MPIVAIGAAVGSLALGGASAIGAVVAGTATLATTLTAVATVGSVLGAVGAVTHDKTLSTVGMVMGGVGAVGSLAANAGLFGASATTQSLFGGSDIPLSSSAAFKAGDAALNSAVDISDIANTIPSLPGSAGGAADIVGALSGSGPVISATPINSAFLSPNGAVNAAAPLPDPMAAVKTAATTPNPVSNLTGPVDPEALTPYPQSGPTSSLTTNAPDTATGLTPQQTGLINQSALPSSTPGGTTPAQNTGGVFGWLKKFVEDDKSGMVKYALVQTAGSFLGGLTDTMKPAQVEALSAQAAANRAAATLAERQNANMSSAIPVARRVQPQAVTGLINTPANTNGVTGQVVI